MCVQRAESRKERGGRWMGWLDWLADGGADPWIG